MDLDGEDSVIASVASLSIKSATSVWTMLKPGFVRWDIAFAEVEGKGRGTKRQPAKPKPASYEDGEDASIPVSEGAWPLLEWLISLFETDAGMTEKEGKRERVNLVPLTHPSRRETSAEHPDGAFYSLSFSAPITHYPGFPQR